MKREKRERERERECYSVFFALVHTQGVHTQGIETGLMRACHAARRNKNGHTAYVHGAGTPHLQWGRGNPPSPGELVSTAVSSEGGWSTARPLFYTPAATRVRPLLRRTDKPPRADWLEAVHRATSSVPHGEDAQQRPLLVKNPVNRGFAV